MQKLWFDTEFNQYTLTLPSGKQQHIIDPISIGIVGLGDRAYSAVFKDFDKERAWAIKWLVDHVLHKLPPESEWKSKEQIREELLKFIGERKTEFRYWYAPQDPIILYSLFHDNFFDVPDHVAGCPLNLAQKFNAMGRPKGITPHKKNKHEVLSDAIWARDIDLAMDEFLRKTPQCQIRL